MTQQGDSGRETESRRIIERVSRETEGGDMSIVGRAARRARDHVTAHDVDRADWAEYWGTRIGRVLGLVLVAGLTIWLVLFVLGDG